MSTAPLDLDLLRTPCDQRPLHDVPPPAQPATDLRALADRIAEVLAMPALAMPVLVAPAVAVPALAAPVLVAPAVAVPAVAVPAVDGPPASHGTDGEIRWVGDPGAARYPVIAGVPLLMLDYAHDAVGPLGVSCGISPRELDHYTAVGLREAADASHSDALRELWALRARVSSGQGARDADVLDEKWVDATYDGPAQLRCYSHLREPLRGGTAVQVGGGGKHALKFLLAGAARAVVVAPIVGELVFAIVCARRLGLADRLVAVAGTGEALPLATGRVDALYCGGTLHHMDTACAGRELARVLSPHGRFAAAEPWKVPLLHHAGTRLLGKREPVPCRPIDRPRLAALRQGFRAPVDDRRHGAFTRYPALALGKAGVHPPAAALQRLMLCEDDLRLPGSALGSSLSVTGGPIPAR